MILIAFIMGVAHAGFGLEPHQVRPPHVKRKISPAVELLRHRESGLILKRTRKIVPALTRLDGVLVNSILATNLRPVTFIVRITSGDYFLQEAELGCAGMAPERRVVSRCDLLVVAGEEYAVSVEIWDIDGAGMLPDIYHSGKEKSFLTSSFATFLGGIWDAAKDSVTTPFGVVSKKNGKNAILQGLSGASQNAQNLIAEDGRKSQSVSFVNSGRPVKIFFKKRLNLKEVRP